MQRDVLGCMAVAGDAAPGAATDGRAYVATAFSLGATACLVEAQDCEPWQAEWRQFAQASTAQLATYTGLKADTGWIADAYYNLEHSAASFSGGWLHTGDVAVVDQEGTGVI